MRIRWHSFGNIYVCCIQIPYPSCSCNKCAPPKKKKNKKMLEHKHSNLRNNVITNPIFSMNFLLRRQNCFICQTCLCMYKCVWYTYISSVVLCFVAVVLCQLVAYSFGLQRLHHWINHLTFGYQLKYCLVLPHTPLPTAPNHNTISLLISMLLCTYVLSNTALQWLNHYSLSPVVV